MVAKFICSYYLIFFFPNLFIFHSKFKIMRLSISFIGGILVLCNSWLFLNDIHHLFLDCFFFKREPIFVPDEIWCCIVAILLHAAFE